MADEMVNINDNCQSIVETDGCPTAQIMWPPKFSEMDARPEDILDSGLESMNGLVSTSGSIRARFDTARVVSGGDTRQCEVKDSFSQNILGEFGKLCVDDDFDDEGVECKSLRTMSRVSLEKEDTELLGDSYDHLEVDMSQRDDDGDTILHVTIISEMKPVALTLIELCTQSCWLNIQNYLLQTALHLAVLTGQVEIVETLVNMGADVTLRDHQGNTALNIACRLGDLASVKAIVKQLNQDVTKRTQCFNMKNCDGVTCVHIAATNRKVYVLKYLIENGADINVADAKSGRTVLHNVVETNDIELVTFLLSFSKLKVDSETFSGETPLVIAYWRNHRQLIKLLKKRGAYFSYDKVEQIFDDNS